MENKISLKELENNLLLRLASTQVTILYRLALLVGMV